MSELKIRPIPEALQKKANKELNENVQLLSSELETIRTWIKQSGHLRARTDDQFLVGFLRACKHSIERLKEKMDIYYSIRSVLPEVMDKRDPLNPFVRKVIQMGVTIPLPKTVNPDDPKIVLIRAGAFDGDFCDFPDILKVFTMIADLQLRDDDQMVICGQTAIIDLGNSSSGHFFNFNVSFLKKAAILNQQGSPLRQKEFHFINTPKGFDIVVSLFRSLMTEKNRGKTIVSHGSDVKSLQKYFPKSVLPTEYGGDLGPVQQYVDYWEQRLIDDQEYLIGEQKFGVDESKRRSTNPLSEEKDLFGTAGTFRKLEFD
ncbi:alpha-tocopherol transfer protein-like [Culex quinquefasciatus]|uniref:alpha-tocopherol transfer protein-like n=1 Tax=Culex quinquefasciatus TaxID=7176 RepID=UPI0018E303F5|nr:alpha-tocopherol transfer protein-like [Culex quinquefasciatus]XP_039440868.1 alpha-tocopherol transfer protein-like [Culex pipiens pallens]XP_039440869.1 alpha-tocopherol transfer protein-like [Culex pipiens pallens]